jgi:hypothetical protein
MTAVLVLWPYELPGAPPTALAVKIPAVEENADYVASLFEAAEFLAFPTTRAAVAHIALAMHDRGGVRYELITPEGVTTS